MSSISLHSAPRSWAVVSGKGGSGKTLIAAVLAQAFSYIDKKVVLIDADFGTGGLTYYLGFGTFNQTRAGLSEYVVGYPESPQPVRASPRQEAIDAVPSLANVRLIPVGDNRLVGSKNPSNWAEAIPALVTALKDEFDAIIFDCRGGIDEQSVAICAAVDEVLMVVETDAASIKASEHLVDVLQETKLDQKLVGFVLNKVMDDPSGLAKTGQSFFRASYLGAVPFDIEATRGFIKGTLPSRTSLFSRHVFRLLSRLINDAPTQVAAIPVLLPSEFDTISLKDPRIRTGMWVLTVLAAYTFISATLWYLDHYYFFTSLDMILWGLAALVLFVAAISDGIKLWIGGLVTPVIRSLSRRLSGGGSR